MFTKQHYKAIAEIIKDEKDNWGSNPTQVHIAIAEIAKDLAAYFAKDNPHFDRQKFLAACGLA